MAGAHSRQDHLALQHKKHSVRYGIPGRALATPRGRCHKRAAVGPGLNWQSNNHQPHDAKASTLTLCHWFLSPPPHRLCRKFQVVLHLQTMLCLTRPEVIMIFDHLKTKSTRIACRKWQPEAFKLVVIISCNYLLLGCGKTWHSDQQICINLKLDSWPQWFSNKNDVYWLGWWWWKMILQNIREMDATTCAQLCARTWFVKISSPFYIQMITDHCYHAHGFSQVSHTESCTYYLHGSSSWM